MTGAKSGERLQLWSMIHPRPLLICISLAFGALSGGAAQAYDIRTGAEAVVELFTSQGCSRCPEADAYLSEMAQRGDVVPLAYHVDYWDYAGWEDTFALPANTQLQKAYASSWGKNRIYTPQMVINGARGVVGSQHDEVETALADAALALDFELVLEADDTARITAPADESLSTAIVWLVPFKAMAEVPVERGENSGLTLTYSHIVTGRQPIGMWSPQTGADITIPLAEALGDNDGAAILIQEKNGDLPGPILGSALISR